MKFYVSTVFCICFVQICLGSFEMTEEMKNGLKKQIRDGINGVSEQFIDDWLFILENQLEKYIIRLSLGSLKQILTEIIPTFSPNISKIDVNTIRGCASNVKAIKILATDVEEALKFIEYQKIVQLILSKEFPPERYMGIINLMYATAYPNATTNEIESALDYLYGTGNPDLKNPLINFPSPNATDCPKQYQEYSAMNDELKSMIEIKPDILRDVTIIIEKFSCNSHYILVFLEDFIKIIKFYRGDSLVRCLYKATNSMRVGQYEHGVTTTSIESLEIELKVVELILSSRLNDETFRGIMNLEKAFILKAPIDEIKKALEYVFINLPDTDCSPERKHEAE